MLACYCRSDRDVFLSIPAIQNLRHKVSVLSVYNLTTNSRTKITFYYLTPQAKFKMLSVNAPLRILDFSTQKPSPLSVMVTTARENLPDHVKYFSRPTMKPPRGVLLTPPRASKDSKQARRRQIFLTKVRQAGDDRTWQSRSDQVKRVIHACEGTLY